MTAELATVTPGENLTRMRDYLENPFFFNGGIFKPTNPRNILVKPVINVAIREEAPWLDVEVLAVQMGENK